MAQTFPSQVRFFWLKSGLLAAFLTVSGLVITGCDDGGTMKSSAATEAKISGMVTGTKGPITSGRIEVKDKNGVPLASTDFDGGRYSVTVPSGATYPITLTATPAPDSATTDPLKAAVTSAIADRQDISAVSTYVVDNAIALGGLTNENIAKASGGAIGMRQSQGVSAGAGGGGGGAGQSGGGTSRGGHGGHDMSDKSSGSHDMSKMGGDEAEKK